MLAASAVLAQAVPGAEDRPNAADVATALTRLKSQTTDQNFAKMGFQTFAEVSTATFGDPIRRYIVRVDKLVAFQRGTDPASVIEDTRQWVYPVMAGREVRAMVIIAWRAPGGWKAISFGDQGLARVLFNTRAAISSERHPPRPDLYFLVDALAANRKFLAIRTDGGLPQKLPGQRNIQFTWLGSLPAGNNNRQQLAEDALSYLSARLPKNPKGPA